MKFFAAAALALAALATATKECTPATYECTANGLGWEVCDVSGYWVFAGDCPPDTVCKFFEGSQSPYCVPADFEIS